MLTSLFQMQRAQIQCLEVVSRKNYFPFTEIENVQGSTFVPTQSNSCWQEATPTTAIIPLTSTYHEPDPILYYGITT